MSDTNIFIKSKLLKLKEWLTIPDTAKHLSIIFREEVNEADVFRLGLDRHLTLSVNFVNNARAKRCGKFLPLHEWEKNFKKMATWQNAEFFTTDNGRIVVNFRGFDPFFTIEDDELTQKKWFFSKDDSRRLKSAFLKKYSDEKQNEFLNSWVEQATEEAAETSKNFNGMVPPCFATCKGKVYSIGGIWDLPILSEELFEVEREYQSLTNGPEVTVGTLFGGAVVKGEDGTIWMLQDELDESNIEVPKSDEQKRKELDFYSKFLEKKISENAISKKEAETMYEQKKENLDKPETYNDRYYPAGGLPHGSVFVVRTRELKTFLNRIESEYSDEEILKDIPVLDSNHRFHAKELKIAIEAWTELYEKNPPQHVPQGGHKRYIATWLENHHPALGQRAKDRICTIINPNPKGGASPVS